MNYLDRTFGVLPGAIQHETHVLTEHLAQIHVDPKLQLSITSEGHGLVTLVSSDTIFPREQEEPHYPERDLPGPGSVGRLNRPGFPGE